MAKNDLGTFLDRFILASEGLDISVVADAYLEMIARMFESRLHFMRTGEYPCDCENLVASDVYDDESVMTPHAMGLALSMYIWQHHYKILNFYLSAVKQKGNISHSLEVGCAAGVFIAALLDVVPRSTQVDVVDISETSLGLTEKLVKKNFLDNNDVRFHHCDILKFESSAQYDFIGMGELLEHVTNPQDILLQTRELLADDGKLFISTCANCPAIDHVYHFQKIDEIQSMIESCAYRVVDELIVPSENKSWEVIEKNKLDISYAAILEKA